MKLKLTIERDADARPTQMDFQFQVLIYDRAEYLKDKGNGHVHTEWGGVEFGNSWTSAIQHAKQMVEKDPRYLCVVHDRMNRKTDVEL